MSNERHIEKAPLSLRVRVSLGIIAIVLAGCAGFVYFDNRIGILGEPGEGPSTDVTLAVLLVISALCMISALLGKFVGYGGMQVLEDGPDIEQTRVLVDRSDVEQEAILDEAVKSDTPVQNDTPKASDLVTPTHVASEQKSSRSQEEFDTSFPNLKGTTVKVDITEADKEFIDAARNLYKDLYLKRSDEHSEFADDSFIKEIRRSKRGRPNYFVLVATPDGELEWIFVPHRGRAGAGAGTATL